MHGPPAGTCGCNPKRPDLGAPSPNFASSSHTLKYYYPFDCYPTVTWECKTILTLWTADELAASRFKPQVTCLSLQDLWLLF